VGANAEGYFTNVAPLQTAVTHALMSALVR
jgi:hypothetical protein